MFENLSGLFSPNLIDQSSCRILITHATARPIFQDDWPISMGEQRSDRVPKHLAIMLLIKRVDVRQLQWGPRMPV